MNSGQIVGIVFIAGAVMDLVFAFALVGPRVADESKRRIVQIALTLGAVTMLAFGVAFLSGALGLGSASNS